MPKLTVIDKYGKQEIAFEGEKLLSELLQKNSVNVPHPCGGRGSCKKCSVIIDGREELSCRYILNKDTVVKVPDDSEIFSSVGARETGRVGKNMCLCLDIGTTTLALALVSPDSGDIVKTLTAANPQRAFGADVISRIDYCAQNGVAELQKAVISAVNVLTEKLLGEFGLSDIQEMYVAGNTTMLHILFGVDCSSIGVSPYTPTFLESKKVKAETIGVNRVHTVVSLPNISSFVGADIAAGINYVGFPCEEGKYNLLIDLGTNAEIALFYRKKILCTAAAAGPCFEGANIECGMTATEGAVCSYSADGGFNTIGGAEAKGICATGLVDIIAELVRQEIIDESGYMEGDFNLTEKVRLTPKDVREFQLAKSAVMSAIECLADFAGITFDNIEKLYVAGGFSSKLNVENAAYAGLIPKELCDKFRPINNSSLLGTVKYAYEKSNMEVFIDKVEYVDISSSVRFSELFMENMEFYIA